MYEQNNISWVSRLIWLVISLAVIVGIVWLLLWLLFWRGNDTAEISTNEPTTSGVVESDDSTGTDTEAADTSSTESASGVTTDSTADSATTSSASSEGHTSSTSTTTPALAQPTELADTGPGEFIAPIALAVAGSTVYYQIRLRRKQTN